MKAFSVLSLLVSLVPSLPAVHGFLPRSHRIIPPVAVDIAPSFKNSGQGVFKQYIDHNNTALGTFDQRFWYNSTFWGGPGYPIVLFTPGEIGAADYVPFMSDRASPGALAKKIKGAVVMIEHRYWGTSTPFKVQDTKALQYLTLENSIADLNYFAREVKLPFATDGKTKGKANAPDVPWIFTGWSYGGALAAWTAKLAPGTFWAYWASSGPVQLIDDFWQYFEPIKEGMPSNCSADFVKIIQYTDNILLGGNKTEIKALKASFGLASLEHDDDFASALSVPLGEWQSNSFTTGYSVFFQMCDAIQGVVRKNTSFGMGSAKPAPNGTYDASVSTEAAVANFAAWFKTKYLPTYCHSEYKYDEYLPPGSTACLESYDPKGMMYTDMSSENHFDRTWYWMLCNEPFGYWQTGAPNGKETIVSRLVTSEYFQRQCPLFFPGFEHASARKRSSESTIALLNAKTGGWLQNGTERLLFVNGEFDPWRSASVSSKFRPGGPVDSTNELPVFLIKNGSHCTDVVSGSANVNPELKQTVGKIMGQIQSWVDDFYKIHGSPENTSTASRAVKAWWA